jgi:hypothetical protein
MSEQYNAQVAKARSAEERRLLRKQFAAARRAQREEDVRLGKREPGVSIRMHRIMWATWLEVAVEHELEAQEAFLEITHQSEGDALVREFRASLLAVAATAHAIEALFGDIKYLIPPQSRKGGSDQRLRRAFRVAFGVPDRDNQRLAEELAWLFERRDFAVHPYTEAETPRQHPAGVNTGTEHSSFNAVTSCRAVGVAMDILEFAERPPAPHGHRIERWASDRAPYHTNVVAPLRESHRAVESSLTAWAQQEP